MRKFVLVLETILTCFVIVDVVLKLLIFRSVALGDSESAE